MTKDELITKLKNANLSDNEVDEIIEMTEISQEAKENIALISQIGLSATGFVKEIARQLKESHWKSIFDLILIAAFLITLIILACFELIDKQNTSTLFALIIGYVLARFKKGINV